MKITVASGSELPIGVELILSFSPVSISSILTLEYYTFLYTSIICLSWVYKDDSNDYECHVIVQLTLRQRFNDRRKKETEGDGTNQIVTIKR